jgi:hypothetical protein
MRGSRYRRMVFAVIASDDQMLGSHDRECILVSIPDAPIFLSDRLFLELKDRACRTSQGVYEPCCDVGCITANSSLLCLYRSGISFYGDGTLGSGVGT